MGFALFKLFLVLCPARSAASFGLNMAEKAALSSAAILSCWACIFLVKELFDLTEVFGRLIIFPACNSITLSACKSHFLAVTYVKIICLYRQVVVYITLKRCARMNNLAQTNNIIEAQQKQFNIFIYLEFFGSSVFLLLQSCHKVYY